MSSTMSERAPASCPQCRGALTPTGGYVVWCPACDWNVQPQQPEAPAHTLGERMLLALARRNTASLFESLRGSAAARPRPAPATYLAYAVAALTYALTLGAIAAVAAVLLMNIGSLLNQIIAGLLLFALWKAIPRAGPPPSPVIPREQAPALYTLLDQICAKLAMPPVAGVLLTREYNAMYLRHGLRGSQYVFLGMPLMATISAQEQVALLAHEIAHGANGDPGRGRFLSWSLDLLASWYRILMPTSFWEDGEGIVGIFAIPFRVLLLLVAKLIGQIYRLLLVLIWRDSQRAEYFADYLASQIAGTGATLTMLEKLHVSGALELIINRHDWQEYNRHPDRFISALRQALSDLPEHERERLRRVARLDQSRVDTTHPPTRYRLAYLQDRPPCPPVITRSEAEGEQIIAELSRAW